MVKREIILIEKARFFQSGLNELQLFGQAVTIESDDAIIEPGIACHFLFDFNEVWDDELIVG